MKKLSALLALALIVSSVSASTSHALVRKLADCVTSDGAYRITIMDNQGIGPIRKSNPGATITHSDGSLVGTYPVEFFRGPQSISFGRPHYIDSATKGKLFVLSGPSTNFRHYSVRAMSDDATISDDDLKCSLFQH